MLIDAALKFQKMRLNRIGFESRFIDTEGGSVHAFVSEGKGDMAPLVLLHGISAAAAHYITVLPELRRSTRKIIAVDLLGHGFSDTPADGLSRELMTNSLRQSLDALIDEPSLVIGNSLGGIGAVRYTAERPENIKGVILCSPGGAHEPEESLQEFLQNFRFSSHQDAMEFVRKVHNRPPWYRHAMAVGVRQSFAKPSIRGLLEEISSDDLIKAEELAGLVPPIVLMWGTDDRLMPRRHFDFYRTHLPDHAQVMEPEGFGHCPYLDTPASFAKVLRDTAMELDTLGNLRRKSK